MNRDILLGVIRHALTVLAGVVAQKGYVSNDDAQLAAGALITLGTVIWSAYEKLARK